MEFPIRGLEYKEHYRTNNGQDDSFVVPFPSLNPMNIVTHGEGKFDYGHFGIHLGQMDRLMKTTKNRNAQSNVGDE